MAVIPSTDVNLATEVRDVLSAAGGSVSNDLTSFFKAGTKINVWAKYKPVIAQDLFYDLDTWKNSAYKGSSHTCGFTIPTYSTMATFFPAVYSGNALWTYNRPTGGSTSPYRLGDFRMYNPDAKHPVGSITTNGQIDANGYATFSVGAVMSDTYDLGLEDIDLGDDISLTSYYLGVLAWNSSSNYKYITHTSPIGSDGSNFTLSLQLHSTGTWHFVPFLSSVVQTGTEKQGKYLLLGTDGQYAHNTVDFISSSASTSNVASALWNNAGTQIILYQISFDNLTSSSVTFSNIRVFFRTGDKPAEGSNIGQYNYSGSVTVPANTRGYIVETSYSFAATFNQNTAYWVGVSSNQTNNGVNVWMGIEEPFIEG